MLLFRRVGWDSETYSEWSQRLAREGVILCLPTTWHGETAVRLAFVNPAPGPSASLTYSRRCADPPTLSVSASAVT